MLTSERVNLWEQAVLNAHTAEAIQPGIKMTISAELVLEMDKYLDKLNEDLLKGMTVFGCVTECLPVEESAAASEDPIVLAKLKEIFEDSAADPCDYCGGPITDGKINTSYGAFHIHCHGPAARELPQW